MLLAGARANVVAEHYEKLQLHGQVLAPLAAQPGPATKAAVVVARHRVGQVDTKQRMPGIPPSLARNSVVQRRRVRRIVLTCTGMAFARLLS